MGTDGVDLLGSPQGLQLQFAAGEHLWMSALCATDDWVTEDKKKLSEAQQDQKRTWKEALSSCVPAMPSTDKFNTVPAAKDKYL